MAIRSNLLGGTDYSEEGLKPSDQNGTNDAIIDFAGKGIAQNAYQTLQANNVFDNKDFLAADEFTDSDGTNDTVNTGTTTADYDSEGDKYQLTATTGTAETTGNTTSYDQQITSFSTSISISNTGFFSTIRSQNAGSGGTLTVTISENSEVIASKSASEGSANTVTSVTFTESDYLRLLKSGQTATVSFSSTNAENVENTFSYSGTDFSITSQNAPGQDGGSPYIPFEFTDSTFDSSKILVCDANTLTLDGTEKSILVYAHKTVPTNTTLTVDISDGSTTLSAQALNTVIDVSSLGVGTLKLTFNFAQTDSSLTPNMKGYGVYLYK